MLRDFGDIVQLSGGDGNALFHCSPYRKQIEKRQMGGIGNQQAGHALQLADMQGALGSVGQGVGQIAFARALCSVPAAPAPRLAAQTR